MKVGLTWIYCVGGRWLSLHVWNTHLLIQSDRDHLTPVFNIKLSVALTRRISNKGLFDIIWYGKHKERMSYIKTLRENIYLTDVTVTVFGQNVTSEVKCFRCELDAIDLWVDALYKNISMHSTVIGSVFL